ncbi:hypothetical protein EDB29_104270 [Vibrio crassostreae]|nr:hypothetical protein EDB29_104270 [Vibrio crassostreae]
MKIIYYVLTFMRTITESECYDLLSTWILTGNNELDSFLRSKSNVVHGNKKPHKSPCAVHGFQNYLYELIDTLKLNQHRGFSIKDWHCQTNLSTPCSRQLTTRFRPRWLIINDVAVISRLVYHRHLIDTLRI